MTDRKPKGKLISVNLHTPPGFPSQYATNLVVQHTEHEFVITFFEMRPPPLLGTEQKKRKQLDAVKEIDATCLARIIVSPNRMGEFIQVMQDNLKTFEGKVATPATAAEDEE